MRFFQIGSGWFAEYAYLCSENRAVYEKSLPPTQKLPLPLSVNADWEGVLVEAHPFAFACLYQSMRSHFPDAVPKLKLVLGAISTLDEPFSQFQSLTPLSEHGGSSLLNINETDYIKHPRLVNFPMAYFEVATFTVEQLIELGGEPDFVLLDIEGFEVPILRKFLEVSTCGAYQIEAHTHEAAALVEEAFAENGFDIVLNVKGLAYDRSEIQAVRREEAK